jgi:hypothetical protein
VEQSVSLVEVHQTKADILRKTIATKVGGVEKVGKVI